MKKTVIQGKPFSREGEEEGHVESDKDSPENHGPWDGSTDAIVFYTELR